jgi:hypothetical protein
LLARSRQMRGPRPPGSLVYFYRKDRPVKGQHPAIGRWHGVCRVIGHDGHDVPSNGAGRSGGHSIWLNYQGQQILASPEQPGRATSEEVMAWNIQGNIATEIGMQRHQRVTCADVSWAPPAGEEPGPKAEDSDPVPTLIPVAPLTTTSSAQERQADTLMLERQDEQNEVSTPGNPSRKNANEAAEAEKEERPTPVPEALEDASRRQPSEEQTQAEPLPLTGDGGQNGAVSWGQDSYWIRRGQILEQDVRRWRLLEYQH